MDDPSQGDSGVASAEQPLAKLTRDQTEGTSDSGVSSIRSTITKTIELSRDPWDKLCIEYSREPTGIHRRDFALPVAVLPPVQDDEQKRTGSLDPDSRRDSAISSALSETDHTQHTKRRSADPVDDIVGTEFLMRAERAKVEARIARWDCLTDEAPTYSAQFDELPRVEFLPVPVLFRAESHLEDHCHLNLAGYQCWTEVLYPTALDMLTRAEEMRWAARRDQSFATPQWKPDRAVASKVRPRARTSTGRYA